MNDRPTLTPNEIRGYGAKLSELARWTADRGMQLAYHHHMGAVIESGEDVNRLMDATTEDVALCYDTGHLHFGGGDVLATLRKWGGRIRHVHYKNIREDVVRRVRAEGMSFLEAIVAGAFTVPGDPEGCIDFAAVTDELKRQDYSGWIVVEAEQDPAKAPPYEYSKTGYDSILALCESAGLPVESRRET